MRRDDLPSTSDEDELSGEEAFDLAHGLAAALYRQARDSLRSPNRLCSLLTDGQKAHEKFDVHKRELIWVNGGDAGFPFCLVAELSGVTEIELRRTLMRQLPSNSFGISTSGQFIYKKKGIK